MRNAEFWLVYILLLAGQLLLGNYFNLTPYLTLTILPVMVLCISIRTGPVGAMLIAFATGLTVDLLCEGVIGLNAFALVPVAFLRNPIIRLVFGGEMFARGEDFCPRRNGMAKAALATLLVTALFLVLYIWADGAMMRPLWFDAARLGASFAGSSVLSILSLGALAPDTRK